MKEVCFVKAGFPSSYISFTEQGKKKNLCPCNSTQSIIDILLEWTDNEERKVVNFTLKNSTHFFTHLWGKSAMGTRNCGLYTCLKDHETIGPSETPHSRGKGKRQCKKDGESHHKKSSIFCTNPGSKVYWAHYHL